MASLDSIPKVAATAETPEHLSNIIHTAWTPPTEGGGGKGGGTPPKPPGTEGGGGHGKPASATSTSDASATSTSDANAASTASIGNMAISAGNLKQIFIPMPNAQAYSNDSGGVDGGTNDGYNILGVFAHSHGDSRVTPQTQTRRDTELVCNVGVNTGTLAGQGFAATTEMGREVGKNPVARSTAQATYGEAAQASATSIAALENCRDRIAPGSANITVPPLTFDNVAPPAPRVVDTPPPAAPPAPEHKPVVHRHVIHHAPKDDCTK